MRLNTISLKEIILLFEEMHFKNPALQGFSLSKRIKTVCLKDVFPNSKMYSIIEAIYDVSSRTSNIDYDVFHWNI